MFLNLGTNKFYCLPDNYEIIDASLNDILYVLNPTFTPELILRLATSSKEARAYDGTKYVPGVVGLNNIKVVKNSIERWLDLFIYVCLPDFGLILFNFTGE